MEHENQDAIGRFTETGKPCSSKRSKACSPEHAHVLSAMTQTKNDIGTCGYPGCDKPCSSKRTKTCSREHAVALRKLTQERNALSTKEPRVCAHDGCDTVFVPLRSNQKYCNGTHYNTCRNCKSRFEVRAGSTAFACSPHCVVVLGHTDESKEKRRRNSNERWGTDSPLQSDEVKAKIKKSTDANPAGDHRIGTDNFAKSLRVKYGGDVTNASQIPEVKEKKKATSREHYGVDNPMQSPLVKSKVANTNHERHGV